MHQGKALFLITQQAFECPCAQVLCWALARQRPLVRRAGTWTNSGDAVKAVARGWGSRPWEGRILARRAEAWGRPRQGSGGGQDRGLGESRGLGEGRAGVWGRKGLVCCPPARRPWCSLEQSIVRGAGLWGELGATVTQLDSLSISDGLEAGRGPGGKEACPPPGRPRSC